MDADVISIEMARSKMELLQAARLRLAPEQLWVDPDCGLKNRKWPETRDALVNMVTAAKHVRELA